MGRVWSRVARLKHETPKPPRHPLACAAALERARAEYESVLERTQAAAKSSRTSDATYEALSLQLKKCGAAKSDLLRRADAADIAFEEAKFQLQEAQLVTSKMRSAKHSLRRHGRSGPRRLRKW